MRASSRFPSTLALLRLLCVVFLALSWVEPAVADEGADRGTARQLFYEASEAMSTGDHAAAVDLFSRSYTLYPTPTAALGEARALVQLARLVDARERYMVVVNTRLEANASEAFHKAVASARHEVELLEPRIPSLVILVPEDVAAHVEIDGEHVPAAALGTKRPLNPGPHEVRATAPERVPFSKTVTVAEGAVVEVAIVLPTDAAGEASTGEASLQTTLGWIGVALGGAGLAAWGVTGALYLGAEGDVNDACDEDRRCTQSGLDAAERGRALGVANTVSLVAGLACAGIGVTLLLMAPTASQEARLLLAPNGVSVVGTF